MLSTPARCYGSIKYWNCVFAVGSTNFGPILVGIGHQTRAICKTAACYKKDPSKTSCCQDVAQTEGRKVESWPKYEPTAVAWRAECPRESVPPNYDPYRIRVPEVMVPPLPPSNAKWTGLVMMSSERPTDQQGYNQGYTFPQQGQEETAKEKEEEEKDEGLLGLLKSFFGKGKKEKENREDQMPMIDCARTRGPCSGKPPPDPPPCPPPPRKPFPWIYVWTMGAVLGILGLIYKYYLYRKDFEVNADKPVWRPRPKIKRPFHEKDLPMCVEYLIIGTGPAGWAGYQSIIKNDPKAKVFFITREDIMPYHRPPMSKLMWYNAEPPDLRKLPYIENMKRKSLYIKEDCKFFKDPVEFFRMQTGPAVSIAAGWCVVRIDADEHIAWVKTLCGEQPIYYERCLLAPGSQPKNLTVFKSAPKAVRNRVTTFRTIRDLEVAYRKVREAKHIVIIGGGFLGSELAWHLSRMHKHWIPAPEDEDENFKPVKIAHVIKDGGILAGVLPEYLGVWAMERLKCENIDVMPKTSVYDAYESEDGRLKLTLSNGESLVTDYVFVCVGASPREELAAPSFLELDRVNGGFAVNTELEARKHLYVAGDAASVYSQWKGYRLRFEHLLNAEEMGQMAGDNMCGYWTPWNVEPHYWFRLGEVLDMEVVGEVGACMPTIGLFKPCEDTEESIQLEMRTGEFGKPCYKQSSEYKNRYKRGLVFYLRDEIVVGLAFWNLPPIEDRKDVATEILRARPSYQDINLLAELLGFGVAECHLIPPEQRVVVGPCIERYREF